MDINNIPTSKKDAEIYLGAYKQALMDLAAEISTNKVSSTSDVDVHVWSNIETVDLILEEG